MRGAPFMRVMAPDVTASTALWPTASSSARSGLAPHLRDRGRIARLFAMVCMAVVWAYLVGEHKDIYVKPIKNLKHGRRAKFTTLLLNHISGAPSKSL